MLLTMAPNTEGSGVVFGVETDVPQNGGNSAQRREHDRRIGAGTMSRTGASCPCCGMIMTMEDIRLEGRAGRLKTEMTAVVMVGQKGKEYRLPTNHERAVAEVAEDMNFVPSMRTSPSACRKNRPLKPGGAHRVHSR